MTQQSQAHVGWQTHFRDRKALVVGMGRSGAAAAQLLRALGAEVWTYDQKQGGPEGPHEASERHYRGLATIPDAAFEGRNLVVLSPGLDPRPVRAQLAQVEADVGHSIEVHGELSLAMTALIALYSRPPRTTLVTGTNGKSTVTSLIDSLLRHAGHRSFAGGNLGIPLCELVLDSLRTGDALPEHLVLECSSYQLETATALPCEVALLLNVSPDHLDRYDSIDHYAATKTHIFAGLKPQGLALLDGEDRRTPALAKAVPATAKRGQVTGDATEIQLIEHGSEPGLQLAVDEIYPRSLLALAGRHNAKNALFALAAVRHLGLSVEQCRAGLSAFAGLDHRMSFVGEYDKIAYYNDSKATNVAGVLAGLTGFGRPIVLIAGGRAKQGDELGPLAELLAAHGRALVAIGESAQQFLDMARPHVSVAAADTMLDAVERARSMAKPGDAIVLSPACASWDQYQSFAHRGRAFCEAVEHLAVSSPS